MNQQPIPEAALLDDSSVEMMRVWIAGKKLHTSLKVGMYKETMNISEERAWGRILADAARHVANALMEGYSSNQEESLKMIRSAFNNELETPSTSVEGKFENRH